MTGGHYDVDAVVLDPMGKELYKQVKKQYDSFNANASVTGTYKACFSNEFSTFSHKLVYIDFQVGEEEWPVKGAGEKHMTAMTMVSLSNLTTLLIIQYPLTQAFYSRAAASLRLLFVGSSREGDVRLLFLHYLGKGMFGYFYIVCASRKEI